MTARRPAAGPRGLREVLCGPFVGMGAVRDTASDAERVASDALERAFGQ